LSGYIGTDIPLSRLFDEGDDDGKGSITYTFSEPEVIDKL
jgi:hypothetical protein